MEPPVSAEQIHDEINDMIYCALEQGSDLDLGDVKIHIGKHAYYDFRRSTPPHDWDNEGPRNGLRYRGVQVVVHNDLIMPDLGFVGDQVVDDKPVDATPRFCLYLEWTNAAGRTCYNDHPATDDYFITGETE